VISARFQSYFTNFHASIEVLSGRMYRMAPNNFRVNYFQSLPLPGYPKSKQVITAILKNRCCAIRLWIIIRNWQPLPVVTTLSTVFHPSFALSIVFPRSPSRLMPGSSSFPPRPFRLRRLVIHELYTGLYASLYKVRARPGRGDPTGGTAMVEKWG